MARHRERGETESQVSEKRWDQGIQQAPACLIDPSTLRMLSGNYNNLGAAIFRGFFSVGVSSSRTVNVGLPLLH